jgi:hypothetical protein
MATARELILRHPTLSFAVVEKENKLGRIYMCILNQTSSLTLFISSLSTFLKLATTAVK